jgi:multiple sugar transport system permease protein
MTWRNRWTPLVIAITVVLLVVMLFPFFVMIATMIRTSKEVYVSPPRWIPHHVILTNFTVIFTQYNLGSYFKSSTIIAVFSTLVNILLSVPAAYAIARLRFVGRQLALYIYLVVQMFSPVVVIISLFKTFAILNLLDTYTSLILTDAVFTMAFSVWLMSGYFRTIPVQIEEAAFIDGATRLQTVRMIIMPIAAPGLVTTMIYTFIYAWNDFIFSLSFIQSNDKMPLTLGLYRFIGRWSSQWQLLTAAAFLAIIPVLALFYVIQGRLVKGLAGGAVKE